MFDKSDNIRYTRLSRRAIFEQISSRDPLITIKYRLQDWSTEKNGGPVDISTARYSDTVQFIGVGWDGVK